MDLNVSPPSPSLEAWQETLLTALWAPTHDAARDLLSGFSGAADDASSTHLWRGMAAYRSHAAAQSVRTLVVAYPVLAQLLGEENFDALARQLWQTQPPQHGDLARWGGSLVRLIGQLPGLLAAEPYLADVARTEWALHEAATAADVGPDPQSYALLAGTDPAALWLTLAPGTACIASRWPVVTLIEAHDGGPPALALAARRLAEGRAETALVWRPVYRPRLRAAQAGEAAFIAAVSAGQSLLDALTGAGDFDFHAWLAPAVHEGLLLGVRTGDSDPG